MDFYTNLSRYYDDLFPPNPKQIRFLTDRKPLRGKALDIGAGTGGYSAALAEKGTAVEALEIGAMYPRLSNTAEKNGFKAMEMGMEEVGTLAPEAYGLIFCIGNTLVHLADREQVTAFLRDCRGLLMTGGELVIQIVNYDRVYKTNQTELPVIHVPERQLTLSRSYVMGEGKVTFITRLNTEGQQFASETELLAIKREELEECLGSAGFTEIRFYGDFEGAPWNADSPATIVTGCK